MADVPEKPIAEWLRAARQAQTMPSGDPWTYAYLFDRMREDIEWAPAHPNYSKYENGKSTPRRETLAKFVRFWSGRGVEGPDLSPKIVAGSDEGRLRDQFDPADLYEEMRDLTKALTDLVGELSQARQERDDLRTALDGATQMAAANANRLRQVEEDLKALAAQRRGAGGAPVVPPQIEGSGQ